MTSFMIQAHQDRRPSSWQEDPKCAFCRIISGSYPAFRLFENDKVIAILDIQPLRRGHTLVIPKAHYARVSELPAEYAAEVGITVSKVALALTQALQNTGLNVVCNQEYAQAVAHVHYHIIPAPKFSSGLDNTKPDHITQPLTQKELDRREIELRDDLGTDEEVDLLVSQIRAHL